MPEELFFIKHEECREVKGYSRGIIYDLNRTEYHLVPLNLISFLREINRTAKETIQNKIAGTRFFSDYYEFILEHELGFDCNKEEMSFFPLLDLTWKEPSYISNCIIDYNFFDTLTAPDERINFFNKLDSLLIKYLGIRFDHFTIDELGKVQELVECAALFSFKGINLQFSTNEIVDMAYSSLLHTFLNDNINVVKIVVNCYNKSSIESTENVIFYHKDRNLGTVPNFISKVGLGLFSESQTHHPYFNRKLYIGPNGEVKNASECQQSFGLMNDYGTFEELKSVISSADFQEYWNVTKDTMDVCKDCEFRYMCVDNRLPNKRGENEWFHSIECNYNPYICKWKGDEGYQTLLESGVTSNENGCFIDAARIESINGELWGYE